MRLYDLKETATGGSTSAGSIATSATPVGTMRKRQSVYKEDDSNKTGHTAGTSGYGFISQLRQNPHFVEFHELQAMSSGYYAKVELDDGNVYDLELRISNNPVE